MENQNKYDYVILGGGFAGLISAFRLSKKGKKICVIDKEKYFGGLLRSSSFIDEAGTRFDFDQGTHFFLKTGVPEIDEELLSLIDINEWHWFEGSLKEGHYYNGKLDTSTGCLNITSLADDIYTDIFLEFFQAHGNGAEANNLAERIVTDFGKTAYNIVYKPILKKLIGYDAETIAPVVINHFMPYRLKLIDSSAASKLKSLDNLDHRLAHASCDFGQSTIIKGYPRQGGIGVWCKQITEFLGKQSVSLFGGVNIQNIMISNNEAVSVGIESDSAVETIYCDNIISTLPPALFARLCKININSKPPLMGDLTLLHLVVDKELLENKLHWVTVYEPSFRSYRITLYNNIGDATTAASSRITIELLEVVSDIELIKHQILSELIEIGLIPEDTKIINIWVESKRNAFPVFTPDSSNIIQEQLKKISEVAKNVLFLGPSSGKGFGQINTIKDIYNRL